ncbi:MAG: hypothetical protein ACFB6S_00735 [Geminicoccaceae bacterium]
MALAGLGLIALAAPHATGHLFLLAAQHSTPMPLPSHLDRAVKWSPGPDILEAASLAWIAKAETATTADGYQEAIESAKRIDLRLRRQLPASAVVRERLVELDQALASLGP